MNISSKSLALLAVFSTAVGFATFNAGCASTPTRESTGEYVDDSTITAKVKAALVKDPVVKALDVKVETFKGAVQLSGFVNSEAERTQAGNVAASVSGVTSVKNGIVVK
jgi:osmotically-inducible protein OsmY